MFLYHLVPKTMQGTILYPLNELKEKFPQIYEGEVKKYTGRKQILTQIIPHLHCLWNDVLHFSAVDPQKIVDALKDAGGNPKTLIAFQIPAEDLLNKKTIVYLYKQKSPDKKLEPENFIPFRTNDIASYAVLPEETKTYYKETFMKQERPLLFHRVPHILYQGSLNISHYTQKTYNPYSS